MMTLVLRCLLLTLVLALASAGPLVDRGSSGTSDASITFENSRRPGGGGGSSSQHGETSATSVQTSSGEGQQTNQGQATAVSTQEQSNLGSATQVISNQAAIQALQKAGGNDSCGSGSSQQTSDNQVNIESSQLQQNVNGSVVDVQGGSDGFVVVNTNDRTRAVGEPGVTSVDMSGNATVSVEQQSGLENVTQVTNNQGVIQTLQEASGCGNGTSQQTSNNQVNIVSNQQQQNVNGTLVNVHGGNEGVVIINTNDKTGAVVNQTVINDRPIAKQTKESSRCRHICIRPPTGEFYCCDDGTNHRGKPAIHGGQCPEVNPFCTRNMFFRKCGHDGQCADSDKCCYDPCVDIHICKSADLIQ